MALRAPTVDLADSFRRDLDVLKKDFPAIGQTVEDFADLLRAEWNIPHFPIDPDNVPNVYGAAVDYVPAGSDGLGALFILYHATPEAVNKMRDPLHRYTLLAITRR